MGVQGGDRQAPSGGVQGDAGAGDTQAHDEHIDDLTAGDQSQLLGAPDGVQRGCCV
jgi:hypothetical protein